MYNTCKHIHLFAINGQFKKNSYETMTIAHVLSNGKTATESHVKRNRTGHCRRSTANKLVLFVVRESRFYMHKFGRNTFTLSGINHSPEAPLNKYVNGCDVCSAIMCQCVHKQNWITQNRIECGDGGNDNGRHVCCQEQTDPWLHALHFVFTYMSYLCCVLPSYQTTIFKLR